MDSIMLHQLAKRLSLTNADEEPEEYILTKDEEDRIIWYAKNSAMRYAAWKMTNLGMPEGDIELKISLINWDEEIDKDSILRQANSIKHHEIWQKQQRIKEKELSIHKSEELKKIWTARFVYRLMAWTSKNVYGKDLIVNEDNKKLITAVCFFVSRDERFETELKYSFDKGLLIRGISGLGKTHVVKCIEKNELNPILSLSMIDITEEIQEFGGYKIAMGANKILYLDDVGTEEPTVIHFGTKVKFFKNLIEKIYHRRAYSNSIISTNLNFKDIGERYGFRVESRMREMYNVIDITGKDMRINGQ